MKSIFLAPSLLSADFADLKSAIEMVNESEADMFHLDIMDGVFVPNISFGFPIISAIKKNTRKPLDVHLMIVEPEKYIEKCEKAGAYNLTIHIEACIHLHRTIQIIKELGMTAGVAINPHTPVSMLEDILPYIDLVCLMSVNPGFGGQKFIEGSIKKVEQLRGLIQKKNLNVKIEVDGGVNFGNAQALADAGADILVTGNTIFSSNDPASVIKELKKIRLKV